MLPTPYSDVRLTSYIAYRPVALMEYLHVKMIVIINSSRQAAKVNACTVRSQVNVSAGEVKHTALSYADATLGVFHARQTRQDW